MSFQSACRPACFILQKDEITPEILQQLSFEVISKLDYQVVKVGMSKLRESTR